MRADVCVKLLYICMKFCIKQNLMVDCMYTVYVYSVVAMPVILHFIIYAKLNNESILIYFHVHCFCFHLYLISLS